ncbi:SHOCT domain-containing protein [Candidatus Nitrosocosmicus agrestis]|uniref:SHOCT domain-containing protein n=1 Tax=Candidatus Nitrosocosmicus agrestis TaxID=2563600 RepID=UPI0019178F1A|nr:SHOCT domain-containing protein [Candidatus Nitrosocosmicus sp. SS]
MFRIPLKNINEIKTIPITRKHLLSTTTFIALSISFAKSINNMTSQEFHHKNNDTGLIDEAQSMHILVWGVTPFYLLEHLRILKIVDSDVNSRLKFNALLKGTIICTNCYRNETTFKFSGQHLCMSCFNHIYGDIVLQAKDGEYYGGHKFHLAGGKLGDHERGAFYLTSRYAVFLKSDKNPSNLWEIFIPLGSVIIEQWNVHEETRNTNFSAIGVGNEDFTFVGGLLSATGKIHRLVIPYKDENGIIHRPVFGVSSLNGKAIREWAAQLYQVIIKNRQSFSDTKSPNNHRSVQTNDPIAILKMRFAKGEINREEYDEMKKILEDK